MFGQIERRSEAVGGPRALSSVGQDCSRTFRNSVQELFQILIERNDRLASATALAGRKHDCIVSNMRPRQAQQGAKRNRLCGKFNRGVTIRSIRRHGRTLKLDGTQETWAAWRALALGTPGRGLYRELLQNRTRSHVEPTRGRQHAVTVLLSVHRLDGNDATRAGRNARSRQSQGATASTSLTCSRWRIRQFGDLYLRQQSLHVFVAAKLGTWRKHGGRTGRHRNTKCSLE